MFLFQDNICRKPERDEWGHLALLGNRDRLVLLGNRDRLVLLGNRDRLVLLGNKDRLVLLGNRDLLVLLGNRDLLVLLGNRDLLVLLGNRDRLVLLGNQDQLEQKDQKVSRTNDIEIKGKTEAFMTPTVNVGKRGKETPLSTYQHLQVSHLASCKQ